MSKSNHIPRNQTIGKITSWHESHQKYQVSTLNKANEKAISTELVQANIEMRVRRSERLKALYFAENAQYEKELADKGLAIYKDKL